VGVLSSSDLVNPEPAQWIRGEATVGDLMNPEVVSLYADDPAMTAVIEMARRAIHRIIVLDDESKLAGIVTPMDVVCAPRGRQALRRRRLSRQRSLRRPREPTKSVTQSRMPRASPGGAASVHFPPHWQRSAAATSPRTCST
jgi:CBS domain-containing protein